MNLPVLALGLSLYRSEAQIMTTDAFSTALAIASNVDPPICSTSIQTLNPSDCIGAKFKKYLKDFNWKQIKEHSNYYYFNTYRGNLDFNSKLTTLNYSILSLF